jgi:demethylmenaquinone methyltransferase/2-methoxy-6-polyprenyl-1,4-benzoquinol methylase
MLAVGRKKVVARDLQDRVGLLLGDAQTMPFASNSFDGSCISFGIRNVPDRAQGLSEMVRVTRSGGPVVVLELSEPREGLFSSLARFHVHHVVPRLGSWISGEAEYAYLQKSVAAFPPPEEFSKMCEQAGVVDVSVRAFGFGAAHLYVGRAA